MARASEWQRYQLLKGLIETAIEDAISDNGCDWDPNGITIAINPALDEVRAGFCAWWVLGDVDDWHIEYAKTEEEAYGIADLYFDLR